jgi:hypothetical protein
MIADRIKQLVAECDQMTPPSGSDKTLWQEYQHALKQQLITAQAVATTLDVGERTGRFDKSTGDVEQLVGAGGGAQGFGRSG